MTLIPVRAQRWQFLDGEFQFGDRPLLMGIVNVTPDSFSDGGRFERNAGQPFAVNVKQVVDCARDMVRSGVDILDVGGQSTRPGAHWISHEEEKQRIIPILKALRSEFKIPLSIDTVWSEVAKEAIRAGASIVNDISGGQIDPAIFEVVMREGVGLCLGHLRGQPATMQESPSYRSILDEVENELRQSRDNATAWGIPRERICLDPGIGFGKTAEDCRLLLQRVDRFHELGCPLLVGHSRKSFLKLYYEEKNEELPFESNWTRRDELTALWSARLAKSGVQILRVHNVALNRSAVTSQKQEE